ncbi:MAG: GAF domain-containing protein, partial [Oscillatoriales cyanobacterium]
MCHIKDGAIAEIATSPDASLDSSTIARDPLVVQALSEGVAQMTADIARDAARADLQESYQAAGLVAHAVVPAIFRDRLIGLLSLQWKRAQKHDETEVDAFGLYARQVGLAL